MKIHIVQKGDTLWKIAKQYGVDFQELIASNPQLASPDMIMPGMKIKIPEAKSNEKDVKQEQVTPNKGQKKEKKKEHKMKHKKEQKDSQQAPQKEETQPTQPTPPKHPFLSGEAQEEIKLEMPSQPKKPQMNVQNQQPNIQMPYTKDELYTKPNASKFHEPDQDKDCQPWIQPAHPYYEIKQEKEAVYGGEEVEQFMVKGEADMGMGLQGSEHLHQPMPFGGLQPHQVQPVVQYVPVYICPSQIQPQHHCPCQSQMNHSMMQHQMQSPMQHEQVPQMMPQPYANGLPQQIQDQNMQMEGYPMENNHPMQGVDSHYGQPNSWPEEKGQQQKHYVDESCYRESPLQPPNDQVRLEDRERSANEREVDTSLERNEVESNEAEAVTEENVRSATESNENVYEYNNHEVVSFNETLGIRE